MYDGAMPSLPIWPVLGVVLVAVLLFLQATLRIFAEYERGVVLRFGRLNRVVGPGIVFLVPWVDVVYARVDMRVISSQIIAEKTLTSDMTPIDVNAIIFWRVVDAQRAALEVANYTTILIGAAQTALREIIGRSSLNALLADRANLDVQLEKALSAKAAMWGLSILSIEIRDVTLPEALQNAMSQQAQAEREREARVILGSAERDIAAAFDQAAQTYKGNPLALELRRMNILYEGLKTGNTTMIVIPSSIAEAFANLRLGRSDAREDGIGDAGREQRPNT